MDLESFFSAKLPLAAGEQSTFGSMLDRQMAATNESTKKAHTRALRSRMRPRYVVVMRRQYGTMVPESTHEPEVTVAEMMDVKPSASGVRAGAWDEVIAAYIDARRRQARAWTVLQRIPVWSFDVLEARYAPSQERASKQFGQLGGVALLTGTAKMRRDHIASEATGGKGSTSAGSVRAAVEQLLHAAGDSTVPADVRSGASVAVERIRKEAEALLRQAEARYVEVAIRLQKAAA
jgi:hypothetical protein